MSKRECRENGKIEIHSIGDAKHVEVEVYNNAVPVRGEQKDKWFKNSAALKQPMQKRSKGPGFGVSLPKRRTKHLFSGLKGTKTWLGHWIL